MARTVTLKEDAVEKLLNGQTRTAYELYEGQKPDTLAGKLFAKGIRVSEYAKQLGYEDAASFLKSELGIDIKTLKLEELWSDSELFGMMPELFMDTILLVNLNAMVTNNFVTEIPIDRGDITIRTFEDAGQVYEIAAGGTIPDDQGVLTRRTLHVKKIARGLGWTYEENRRVAFPLIELNLRRLGQRMALKEDLDTLNVLRTGIPQQYAYADQPASPAVSTPVSVSQSNTGGSGIAAGTLTFLDIITIKTDVANRNYDADFAVMSPVTYSKFLQIPQVTNYLNAGPAAVTTLESGVISHFMGMDLYLTKQMPDNEVFAGQKGYVGVKFVEQGLLMEEEKVISRQTERCQVSKCYVPAMLYTQAATRMPF